MYRRVRAAGAAGSVIAGGWLQHPDDDPPPPTWPIDPHARARMSVRWPSVYEWAPAQKWVQWLRMRLPKHVRVIPAEIPQQYEGVVLIEVEIDGVGHEVAVDYSDGERILDEVVGRCPLVFKMQYALDGYGHRHVVPGGYVPGRASILRYLPGLRTLRARGRPRFDVYGRFGLGYATSTRRTAVELLKAQDRFKYEGSLALLPYSSYLREAAVSRVCIDLPGNGDMCHRLVDYLAIGCCVVRPLPLTRLHVPLVDGTSICYAGSDLANLVDVCSELIAEPRRAVEIGVAARDHFDRFLHPDQLTGYYIDRCLSVLGDGR